MHSCNHGWLVHDDSCRRELLVHSIGSLAIWMLYDLLIPDDSSSKRNTRYSNEI